MTWTHGLRRTAVVALVIAAALAVWFWGNQRYVQAEETTLAGQILCYINSVSGPPIPRFHVDECSPPPPPPTPPAVENTLLLCSDGADNDGDSLVDLADPDCSSFNTDDDDDDTEPPPPLAACADGVDNDGDGHTDLADPGCDGASDIDEADAPPSTPPPSGGGGGTTSGGGGGGGGGGGRGGPVLATATTSAPLAQPISQELCDRYLTAFIRSGFNNDESQVRRLQAVLRDLEAAPVGVNGVYDAATLAAVHAFQTKYASEILAPWGARASTGYVYLTTRKKVNEIYCRNARRFDLTVQELATIAETKARAQLAPPPAVRMPPLPPLLFGANKPSEAVSSSSKAGEVIGKGDAAQQIAAVQAAVQAAADKRSLWRRVLDLFKIRQR